MIELLLETGIRRGEFLLLYRYLFISDRGRPLSIRALSNVFDRLFLTIELAHPGLLPTLSHTFADRFLAYLVEKRGHDLERASAAWSRLDSEGGSS
ncbi:hypothetical protein AB3464_01565 [Pseudomonas asplenii]